MIYRADLIIPENVGSMDNVIQGIVYSFHKYTEAKTPISQKHNYRYTLYPLDNALKFPIL